VYNHIQPIQISPLLQVGVPYLRAKAQDYYEELGGGVNSDILDEGMDARQLHALTDQACSSSFNFRQPTLIHCVVFRASRVGSDEDSKLPTHG
jgi:TPP-dependent pyruvate/acetoin dehydrogenase alpha subunit